jgi:hypothetical protein
MEGESLTVTFLKCLELTIRLTGQTQKMLSTIIHLALDIQKALGRAGKNVRILYATEGSFFNEWNMEERTIPDAVIQHAEGANKDRSFRPRKVTVGFGFLNYEESVFCRVEEKCMVVLDYKCDASIIV